MRNSMHDTVFNKFYNVIMAALRNRAGQYFCPVVSFILLYFFFSSRNLSGRRLDVYHTSSHMSQQYGKLRPTSS